MSTLFQPPSSIEITLAPTNVVTIAVAERGPSGAGSAAASIAFPVDVPSAVWTLNHNLGFYAPNVVVVDSSGNVVWGDILLVSVNTTQIVFAAPFAGIAYLG